MNKSYELLEKSAPSAKIEMILDELFDYANYHFAAEENWLREHSYLNLNDHLVEHDDFRKKVQDFRNEFYGGKSAHRIQLFTFLSDWLFNHIRVTDFEYAQALLSTDASDRDS
jgi:hemerythrin